MRLEAIDEPGRRGAIAVDSQARLRGQQVAALFHHVALGVIGAAGAAAILSAGLVSLGTTDGSTGILWVGYITICAIGHLLLRHLYLRADPDDGAWPFWASWFTAFSFLEGLGWGWSALFLVGSSSFSAEMLVLVVTLNIAGAAITAFGSYLPAFFSFFLPATIPCLIWGISSINLFPESMTMVILMSLFILAMSGLGVRSNQNFKELVHLRIQTEALARDLTTQKELAEAASLAKSTFLAAASHDLRQPVHAIGLLVGALRGAALPPESARLVERIEEATSAMDGLFSGILDISRLDAGVVDVHPEIFSLQPLLDRICSDYSIEAAQKSIRLVVHPCGALVETDPLLIERIIRNLVSNAVRHTSKGRVVVGCRRIRDRIRVEIWDTGPGIPPNERERIFQEYFQLQNPQRDRTLGLGLGLAIVRRLSGLLHCPVRLKSVPGRGSCFSVEIAKASEIAPNLASSRPPAPLIRGLVLVIDDEQAIRDAMVSLLTTWGYSVIAAGSGTEMKDLLSQCSVRPDAVICDYRLRDDENGIDVIRDLQAECNEAIPAMLITGDTAPDRLVEAQASGLLLLHKPVPNGKLRAAIASLMEASNTLDAIDQEI